VLAGNQINFSQGNSCLFAINSFDLNGPIIVVLQGSDMAKIVIVDDSKLVRDLVARSLVDEGHEVQVVDPISLFDVLKVVRQF